MRICNLEVRACAATATCSIIIYHIITHTSVYTVRSSSDLNNRCSAAGCVGLERPEVGLKTNLVDVVAKKLRK